MHKSLARQALVLVIAFGGPRLLADAETFD
jgi:hypothetical protein